MIFDWLALRSNQSLERGKSLLKGHLLCQSYLLTQENTKHPQGKILPHDPRSALGTQMWLVLEVGMSQAFQFGFLVASGRINGVKLETILLFGI